MEEGHVKDQVPSLRFLHNSPNGKDSGGAGNE